MPLPNLRMPATSPARIKNLIHGFQAVLIFFAWVLTIAVFTKSGGIDGRTGWYFGVVSRLPDNHLLAPYTLANWDPVLALHPRSYLSRRCADIPPRSPIRQCLRIRYCRRIDDYLMVQWLGSCRLVCCRGQEQR